MCQLVRSNETFILMQLCEVGGKVTFAVTTVSRHGDVWASGRKAATAFDCGTGIDYSSLLHAAGLHCVDSFGTEDSRLGGCPLIAMSECNFIMT
jgi:hypothetical protein